MPTLTLPLVELLIKVFKTHCTAIDFDAGSMNNGFVQVLQGVIANNLPFV
jgi:hypothetical protein